MFTFEKTNIDGLIVIKPQVYADIRGYFLESYKRSEFIENGITEEFVQDNISVSVKNVLRGLHYQDGEYAQGKLVRCLQGEIFDVAVDIRSGSQTFGKWFGITLSSENHTMLYLPAGFAHGFVTRSDKAIVLYKATAEYAPKADKGIIWNDASIGIDWGIDEPILSEKDKTFSGLRRNK